MQEENYNHDEYILQGALGRHETFTPRYGWLKKGYEAALQNEDVFKAKDAIERLGVGKNMVSSIRYWCQAFKLFEPNEKGKLEPSLLGHRLLDDNGWDPYLEDVASLWLLHWQLMNEKNNYPIISITPIDGGGNGELYRRYAQYDRTILRCKACSMPLLGKMTIL